jgi:hypothetical protein
LPPVLILKQEYTVIVPYNAYIYTTIHGWLVMKILLTGATGYIGQRLLPVLLEEGHEVVCCVRDK